MLRSEKIPSDQFIFENFFSKLNLIEPRVNEKDPHLLTKTKPPFHNLKDKLDDDFSTQTLLNCKAAHNLAKTIQIAIQEKSVKIFSPSPLTISSKTLFQNAKQLDPKLMEILLPVLKLSSEKLPALIPRGFGFLAKGKLNDIKQATQLIEERLAKIQKECSNNKKPSSQHQMRKTFILTNAKSNSHPQFNQIYIALLREKEELHRFWQSLRSAPSENKDWKEIATFGKLTQEIVMKSRQNIKSLRNEIEMLLDEEVKKNLAIKSSENFNILLKKLKNCYQFLESFQGNLKKGDCPPYEETLAALFHLTTQEKQSWKNLSALHQEDNSTFLYHMFSSFTSLASYFISYLMGWNSTASFEAVHENLKSKTQIMRDKIKKVMDHFSLLIEVESLADTVVQMADDLIKTARTVKNAEPENVTLETIKGFRLNYSTPEADGSTAKFK